MCDWNICPPVTAVLFLQSVLATTVHQSNMCILWAWHTNHRDVISFGLLTVQCLRADRAPISSSNRTSNWELQKMPFPGPTMLSEGWGAASSKAEQRMKCQTLVFHTWHHFWQLHQNNHMEGRCQYLLGRGCFINAKNLDISDSQVLHSWEKSFPAK